MREIKPADWATPVVIHSAVSGPGPAQLSEALDEPRDGSSASQALNKVLHLLDDGIEAWVARGLTAHREEDFALSDGFDLDGMPRDADREEGPEINPFISLGANGRLQGMIVSKTDLGRRGLDVSARGANTGGE